MIQISQVKVAVGEYHKDPAMLSQKLSKLLRISTGDIKELRILRRSVDARKKDRLLYVFTVILELDCDEMSVIQRAHSDRVSVYSKTAYEVKKSSPFSEKSHRPVVIGMGPAGLFCAYVLAKKGMPPLLLERGKPVEERTKDVHSFWKGKGLRPDSNAQFGEGGAGAFSDGKLNTLVKDPYGYNRFVLETFVKFGAREEILYDYKPHIGTDRLAEVLIRFRKELLAMGAEIRFDSRVTDFSVSDGRLFGLIINGCEEIACDQAVLAIGHSARDTFSWLYHRGIGMRAKEFAVGLRVEHPQAFIDKSQFGDSPEAGYLCPAPYKLSTTTQNGRGVYSFCMCPGGYVINASSEEGGLAINGMSYADRGGENANAAIIVTVGNGDFDMTDPMAGIEFQRRLEKNAFALGKGNIPQQLFGDYVAKRPSTSYGRFASAHMGEACFSDLNPLFSDGMRKAFLEGMENFDHKIKGFAAEDVILSGIESRTSSPVRIDRGMNLMSNIAGVFPCGEGAGYAGGITSAAMDGIRVGEAVAEAYSQ